MRGYFWKPSNLLGKGKKRLNNCFWDFADSFAHTSIFDGKCVLRCAWEVRTPTVQQQEHFARLHLWEIFILAFHFPAVLLWEIHIFCLHGSLCCLVLTIWLSDNSNLWLRKEWHFWRKTSDVAWKTGRPTMNSPDLMPDLCIWVWLARSLLYNLISV